MPVAVPEHPPTFYLAIDPGKATGWAAYTLATDGGEFAFGEVEGRYEFYQALRWWMSAGAIPEVVIEDWDFDADTHKKSRQVDAMRIIGYVEGLCQANGWPFEVQSRAKRKFADDAKLRALGWEATTEAGHAREAARHLLTYLVRKYGKPGQLGHDLLTKIVEGNDADS
jgi:hypothetical protein